MMRVLAVSLFLVSGGALGACAFKPSTAEPPGASPDAGPSPGSNGGSAACPDSGRGDVCDVCPGIADDGTDSDGDGVGDACDPRPAQPGDSIAFFEGFYAPVAWSPVIGSNNWEYVSK